MQENSEGRQDQTHSPQPEAPVKACHRCGADLAHQRRYRDQHGYWCITCSRADHVAHKANHLPCDDCGCDVRRGQERLLDDHRLCDVCWQKRQTEAVRQQMRAEAASLSLQRRRNLRNLSILAAEVLLAGTAVVYFFASGRVSSADDANPSPTTQPLPATGPAPFPSPTATGHRPNPILVQGRLLAMTIPGSAEASQDESLLEVDDGSAELPGLVPAGGGLCTGCRG